MKQQNNQNNQKRMTSTSYGVGVAKIVVGAPMMLFSIGIALGAGILTKSFATGITAVLFYSLTLFPIIFAILGGVLVYNGSTTCRLVANHQKIKKWLGYNNRESLRTLAQVTGQSLTDCVRDLRLMTERGFYPNGYVDLDCAEFAAMQDKKPAPVLSDGDMVLSESVRPSFVPFVISPAFWLVYAIFFGFSAWYDFVIAAALFVLVFVIAVAKTPKVRSITEKPFKALSAPPPEPIKTGNNDLDDLLTTAMDYVNKLNELSLSITNAKMAKPVEELLNVSRQIFAFVEKQPEKVRQIRQFMNYYLPTTIKLLTTYREFSQQPLKGENIREAMEKIEGSMDGVVKIFHSELDNLYSDKAIDVTVDVDMMLAMMRQQGITDDFFNK